jgi:phage anti-repressor protein
MNSEFSIELAKQLVDSEEQFPVNLEDAYFWLDYCDKSTAKRAYLNCGFIENLDYRIFKEEMEGISSIKKENISISLGAFKSWVLLSRKKSASKILDCFRECGDSHINVVIKTRLELEFKELLFSLLGWKTTIFTQHSCNFGNNQYFVDFYIPDYNLVIEYDEKYHDSRKTEDKIREQIICKILNCKFIRVKEKKELEALSKIMQFVFTN